MERGKKVTRQYRIAEPIDCELNEISNEDYAYMVDHMTPYSINIASGVYFKQALATALK